MAWNYDIIDLNEAMTRVLGRKELYKGWLDTFLTDDVFATVQEAFEKKDYDGADLALHKIKGTSGNLSIKSVFELASSLSSKVRNRDAFDTLTEEYEKLRESFFSAKKMYTDNVNDLMNYGELSF
ncbi:MAG: Hpt domain-containing protein [Oscillospiraceae bacterium]|nr:Hpt domain-containing protein [Oscillospiraceae bacterium]